jgi:hypothetical protein
MTEDTWEATLEDLADLRVEINAVQHQFPGKEDRDNLEAALKPLRKRGVKIHERRIALNVKELRFTKRAAELLEIFE